MSLLQKVQNSQKTKYNGLRYEGSYKLVLFAFELGFVNGSASSEIERTEIVYRVMRWMERPDDSDELSAYKDAGINIVAPPMWALLDVKGHKLVASEYAVDAKHAGLDIITWTLERSGPLVTGGGWYYQTITDVTDNDGDMMTTLDVLAQDVGIIGIFSDWPATVTYYANCMGLK